MLSGAGGIAISATFTAEPLRESLEYWLNQLSLSTEVQFAPYNQVIQTLVDPQSVFARNKSGLNVVLVRFEDWDRYGKGPEGQNRELIAGLKTAAAIGTSRILVCICSPSPLEQELSVELAGIPMIKLLSSQKLSKLYPVANYYDGTADRLGHIPYKAEGYAALGTAIARVFHASQRAPYKVIVTDCDNTLWRGICGEGGPHGVELDGPSHAVQCFLKSQQSDGMLLCVCSKNATEDVEVVFDAHPEMPLARSDFAAWRVNWRPKSENIRSLAAELSLGLDSFIFVDDNPMETAEVEANCPGVLALTLPSDLTEIPRFLDHVWAFDRDGLTAEDRNRTALYRENALRQSVLAESLSYADFLRGLELEIEIRELSEDAEIERAAQMTQRTNQFNCTTRRFTEPEIREVLRDGSRQILAAFVRDRYGDYGQVGLVMFQAVDDALYVSDFLLSCRVLGKGVEHAMVARLGEIALERSISSVEIAYYATPKNAPAREFLTSLGTPHRFPAPMAAGVRFTPPESSPPAPESDAATVQPVSRPSIDFAWIATHRSDVATILEAVRETQGIRMGSADTLPRDAMEEKLAHIWEHVLRISPIGVHDNFFDLGGDSLLAVRLVASLKTISDRTLPLVTLVEAPTIAKLAELLRSEARAPDWNYLVPMKSSGQRPPFYCVHGVGGNVLEYMALARYMDNDQPFYGIQAIGLTGEAMRQRFTVEEMAERYLGEVREFQPEGPYYLGGSSFGGWVAYEMARQLAAAGECVGLVAMFDTAVPGAFRSQGLANAWEKQMYRLALHWQNILMLGPKQRITYLLEKARRVTERVSFSRTKEDLRETIRWVNEAGNWAASVYAPGKYSGDITLFRATKQPPWIVSNRTMGWESLVKGEIQIYDTPGHHADLVRNPRARVLAQQLDDALAKAQLTTGA